VEVRQNAVGAENEINIAKKNTNDLTKKIMCLVFLIVFLIVCIVLLVWSLI